MNKVVIAGLLAGLSSGLALAQVSTTGERIVVGSGNAGQIETSTTGAMFEWRLSRNARIQVSADRQETVFLPEAQVNVFHGRVAALGPNWSVQGDSLRIAGLFGNNEITVTAPSIEIVVDRNVNAKLRVPYIPTGVYSCSGGTLFRNGGVVHSSNRLDAPNALMSCDGTGNNAQYVTYPNGPNPRYIEP